MKKKSVFITLLIILFTLSGCSLGDALAETIVAIEEVFEEAIEETKVTTTDSSLSIEELRDAIKINRLAVSAPDITSGVSLFFDFTNTSQKTIKCITFGVNFFNGAGDMVACTVKREKDYFCMATGPFEPGEGMNGNAHYWGKYYNSSILSVKLISINIDYTDGTNCLFTSCDDLQPLQY